MAPRDRTDAAVRGAALLLALAAGAACRDVAGPPGRSADGAGDAGGPELAAVSGVVLVGAGDIVDCVKTNDEQTALLVENVLDADAGALAFTLGDNVYENGTAAEFANCYDPSWGRFKARTRPSVGNHEYGTSGAVPYFNYFGALAGPAGKGYYSFDVGSWHVVVLNSNSGKIATGPGSAQEQWLRADLAATSQPCILAYWHHARFRSSNTTSLPAPSAAVKAFWDDLYAVGADLILSGHQHFYERFAPQTPDGKLDTHNGIRQIIVGTGGKSAGTVFRTIAPNSEVREGKTFGVLKLTLGDGVYAWEFIPVPGKTFRDSGTGTCHGEVTVGPPDPDRTLATVPDGAVGMPTVLTVETRDASGRRVTTGGASVTVGVSGANTASPAVTDNLDGTYTASYTPTVVGTDFVTIRLEGEEIAGSPFTSEARSLPARIVINDGNNQTAPAGSAVPTPPSVKVLNGVGDPVANVAISFSIQSGGGTVSGASQVTGADGVARVGGWTLGPIPGVNKLKARAPGTGLSSVIITATGT